MFSGLVCCLNYLPYVGDYANMHLGGATMVTESDFIDFASQVLGVPAGGLSLSSAYGSMPEWDSVMHLRLVMEFDARYGTSIPIEAVPELKTLGDFYGRIPR